MVFFELNPFQHFLSYSLDISLVKCFAFNPLQTLGAQYLVEIH